jgi:uncharacterized protein (UPF0303 family)
MTTTGGYSSAGLAEQAAQCQLAHFTADDAVTLGLLATRRAREASLPIVIEVHHVDRLAFRAALPGSLPESDDWIQRKRRTVERYQASTMAVRVRFEEQGKEFNEATGLPLTDFAAHGGGFPIVVPTVGIVGGIYASGLPQVDDHEFLVACLVEFSATP